MNITIIEEPPFEPVTLAEVYAQLRLDPDIVDSPASMSHPDDVMLRAQIKAAREFVETATRRALVQQTIRLACNGGEVLYGPRGTARSRPILLRRPPLLRVLSVQYRDASDDLQLIDSANYYVTDDQVPELHFKAGYCLPYLCIERNDSVRVEYVAGYQPAGSPPTTQEDFAAGVPETLKQAVLLGVQLQYDNLSDADRLAMERMRESLIQSKRIQLV